MATNANWNYGQAFGRYTPPNLDMLNAVAAATGNPNPPATAWQGGYGLPSALASTPAVTPAANSTAQTTASSTDPLALYREQMANFNKMMADSQNQLAAWQKSVQDRAASYVPTNAVNTNLANMPNLTELAKQINALNQQQWTQALNARVPGIAQADLQELANIEGAQQYQMPAGLRNVLGQQLAERGVASGSLGPNINAGYGIAVTKALLDRADTAGQRLAQLKASNPAAPLYDLSQMMLTPAQAAQQDIARQQLDLNRDELLGSKLMTPAQAAALQESNAKAMADLAAEQKRLDAAWALAQTEATNRAASNWGRMDPYAGAGYGKGFVMPTPSNTASNIFDYSKLFPTTVPGYTTVPSTNRTYGGYGTAWPTSLYDYTTSRYTPTTFPGYSPEDFDWMQAEYGG